MKIARFRSPSVATARWGIAEPEANEIRAITEEFDTLAARLVQTPGSTVATERAQPLDGVTLLPPIQPASKIVGAGANYMEHLRRRGKTERPERTVTYIKPTTAMVGPFDEIEYPRTTERLDFEVELVAVVGAPSLTAERNATRHLLGYCVGNDVSARDASDTVIGFDLFSMKALDRTTPLGPWIVTCDELGVSGQPDLAISLTVNGEVRQSDRTSEMIFSIDELFEFVTDRVTMCCGDVLFTGTTGGVGNEDQRFLEPGDVVVAEIERVGRLENVVGKRPN